MSCQTHTESDFTVVSLSGEIDLHCSPQARDCILKCLGEKHNVLVDLSKVEYIDSSGIASLVEGLQYARNHDLKFGLVGVSEAAMQVIQLARLDKVFPIHTTINAATA